MIAKSNDRDDRRRKLKLWGRVAAWSARIANQVMHLVPELSELAQHLPDWLSGG